MQDHVRPENFADHRTFSPRPLQLTVENVAKRRSSSGPSWPTIIIIIQPTRYDGYRFNNNNNNYNNINYTPRRTS